MALNFPDSPADGDKFVDAATGESWTYEASTNSWTSDGLTTSAGIIYKGGIDITAAAPAGAKGGWQYTVTTGGTVDSSFTGLTGNIPVGTTVLFDGTNWQKAGVGVVWVRNGTLVAPVNDGDSMVLHDTGGVPSVTLDPGASASPLVRDSSGKLLVGTASSVPVISPSTGAAVQIDASNHSALAQACFYGANDSTGSALMFAKSRNASYGSFTVVQDNDALGGIYWAGDDGSTLSSQVAHVVAHVDGTPAAGSMPGRIVFGTTPSGSTTPVERMRIGADGNAIFTGKVGIGVATPANALHVKAGTNANFVVDNLGGTGGTTLRLSALNDAVSANTDLQIQAKDILFAPGSGVAARFDSSGRLLVGSDTPQGTDLIQSAGNFKFIGANPQLRFNTGGPSIRVLTTNSLSFYNGDGTSGTGGERMRITPEGWVNINGQNEAAALPAPGSGNLRVTDTQDTHHCISTFSDVDYTAVQFVRDVAGSATEVGTITCTSTATTYGTSSDYRLKENVVPLAGAADRVKQLKPSRFNFIVDPSKTVDGFLAHEAQAVVPECATGEKDGVDDEGNPVYQGIDQSKLVPLLTGALQEALTRIEQLEAKVTALESK